MEVKSFKPKVALEGIDVLDSIDRVQLNGIAEECPMVLGEAVFQARGLLTSLDLSRTWNDAAACIMAEPRFHEGKVVRTATLKVWPNPAQNHLFVHLDADPKFEWDIVLFNAYGQVVTTSKLSPGLMGIELPDLTPGLYVLVASNSEGVQLNSRVIVTH